MKSNIIVAIVVVIFISGCGSNSDSNRQSLFNLDDLNKNNSSGAVEPGEMKTVLLQQGGCTAKIEVKVNGQNYSGSPFDTVGKSVCIKVGENHTAAMQVRCVDPGNSSVSPSIWQTGVESSTQDSSVCDEII